MAIKKGSITLNGEFVETSRRVSLGDVLSLQLPPVAAPSPSRLSALSRFVEHLRSQGLRTPYEDDDLAVVYKPPGIHSKAGTNRKYAALEDALPAELTPPPREALPSPLLMHRLDVPVAGLCVVAKTRRAAIHLAKEFEARRVYKTYHALVVGRPEAARLRVEEPIDGRPALSTVEVLDALPHPQWGHLTTLRMRPHTGRTHQLRKHACALGCPIVGDDLYWPVAEEASARAGAALPPLRKARGGLFLQSCAVELEHPDGGRLGVMVREAGKFAALRRRARSGAAWDGE